MFEAIEIGPFIIWTHLVFLLLGVWLSTEFFLRLAARAHLSLQHICDHAVWYATAFAVGGRLLAVVAQYRVYIKDPLRSLILWDGNFSFLGGAMGVGCVLAFVTREHRSTFLQWLDVLVPPTTLGLSFDWLGKFAAGQAYGKPTDVAWGVTYDAMHVRYAVPIHPVQLYYFSFFLFLTFLLLVIHKEAVRAGTETLVGIVLASIATFAFEVLRGDFGVSIFFATFELRFSQILAILSLFSTVLYVIVHRHRHPHL